ncbi:MAG: B12-binding domain-containing radical SAM protein [Candidatus Aminicenantia bacterium]
MKKGKTILLINPWIFDFTAYDFWLKPLGFLYIAGVIKKYTDYRIKFIDCLDRTHPLLPKKLKSKEDGRGPFYKEEIEKPEVLKPVPRKYSRYGIPVEIFRSELNEISSPELILITCGMTYWYPGVQFTVELVRKKIGHVPIILGGIYPTLLPEHAKRYSGVDFILEGAGERKILELIEQITGNKLATKPEFGSLDEIPFPAFEFLRDKRYLPLLTSRGCPYRCTFCAAYLLNKSFQQRESHTVIQEIEFNFKKFNLSHLAFYDDALFIDKENHIIPILKKIIGMKFPIAFHTPNGLQAKEIDYELALLLKKANFKTIRLSLESSNQELLKKVCPKVTLEDFEKALTNLEKAGYKRKEIEVYLIVGLPDQKKEEIEESIYYVYRLGAKSRLAYFSPIPGTSEWEKLVEKELISPEADPLLHNKLAFSYITGSILPSEFEYLKNLSFQLNSKIDRT